MKILYAIQGTGNGHMSRAQVFIPLLEKYGDVDVLISSKDHELKLPLKPKYILKGLGFTFGKNGGINYWKSFRNFNIIRFFYDMMRFPINDYDIVINDFEPLTAWLCKWKGKKIVGLCHHSSYLSKLVPRPVKKDWFTERVLEHHSPCNVNYSFHFKTYDQNIFTPIIRDEIRNGENTFTKTIVVYLPSISAEKLIPYFQIFSDYQFYIFCKHSINPYKSDNVEVFKIDKASYIEKLLSCEGVICNAGFESPSEAIFLGKKLLCITMKGQYEQRCNAQALKELGVYVVDEFDNNFQKHLADWMSIKKAVQISYPNNNEEIIQSVMKEFQIN